jgi:outer membrane protein OmpA-like peptidoglycan-associated protein
MLSANAATIRYEGKFDGVNSVQINGEIVRGDSDQFDQVIASLTGPTVVSLQSPGGIVGEGLNIGIAIRRNNYGTAVAENDMCASICGMIWLAGQPRYRTTSSKIGFHAAFRADGQESGSANALIGAYLSKLGLSYRAIAYLTDAPPDEMHWLTPSDAADVGIIYSLITPQSQMFASIALQPQIALQQYRSDFFGELQRVLPNRRGVQVVGDRFVFQSELLFPVGSADLTVAGWEQIKALASTLLGISKEIPSNFHWILRVDGHADSQPVQSDLFPSNWELSSARAITVVKLLIAAGVPANRLAATAEAYAKNRRIELRLTDG